MGKSPSRAALRVACCVVALTALTRPALASPIAVATLDWTDMSAVCFVTDPVSGGCVGDAFSLTVLDTSAEGFSGSFSNIFVQLGFASGLTDLFHLQPDPVDAYVQDIYQFSSAALFDQIVSASLDLSQLSFSVDGTLTFSAGTPSPLSMAGAFLTIELERPDTTATPTPEPGTLALVGGGIAMAGWRRRRQLRRVGH